MKKTIALLTFLVVIPFAVFADSPAPDTADFTHYFVKSIRFKGKVAISPSLSQEGMIQEGVETREANFVPLIKGDMNGDLPQCRLRLRADVKELLPSDQIYTFNRMGGEGNSTWNFEYYTTDKTQAVQALMCDFWPAADESQPSFSLAMLKKAIGSNIELIDVINAHFDQYSP